MEKIKNGMKFSVIADSFNEMMNFIVPVGAVLPYVGTTAPDGWLLCDGGIYSSNDYPALGKVFGVVGGQFKVPDMNGKYLKGTKNGLEESNGNIENVLGDAGYTATKENYYRLRVLSDVAPEFPYVGLNFIIKF